MNITNEIKTKYGTNPSEILFSKWMHVKTKGVYEIVTFGYLEKDLEPMVIYKNRKDGTVWIRPYKEFVDGRFVKY